MRQANELSIKHAQNRLRASIACLTDDGELLTTPIPGLSLFHRKESTQPVTTIYEPSVYLVMQGAKRVMLGHEAYIYNSNYYLITSVNLPTTVQIIGASQKRPYLGLRLKLKLNEVSEMMIASNIPAYSLPEQPSRGMATAKITLPIVTAFERLVNLLNEQQNIPILAPLIEKEIIYRLLVGEQGACLRQIASTSSQTHKIAKALDWIKTHYKSPLNINEMAEKAFMSHSTFHHHFRSVTGMSPLQYIKILRLYEARRLMLTESFDAANASYVVGYESPSQFSREYKRQFGDSPQRDIKKLSQGFNFSR